MPDPILANVTACTIDPEKRVVLFHLSAEVPGGGPFAFVLPFQIPTAAELGPDAEEEEWEVVARAEKAGHVAFASGNHLDLDEALRVYLEPATTLAEMKRLDAMGFRRGWFEAETGGRRKARTDLPGALRRLAEYLSPLDTPKELREALFMPDPETPDYGPAGKERVLDRLVGDLQEYMEGTAQDEKSCQLGIALHAIMEGATPRDALADLGLLDG